MNIIDQHTSPVVVEFDKVCKNYGSEAVLEGLSLSVCKGELFGFLGRNGAGKSTAIRVLMGITSADAGVIQVFGEPVRRDLVSIRQRIGYVAQEQNFYPWMTPMSLAGFVSGFYPHWSQQRYRQLIDRFTLPEKRRVGTFSGGMKARLALSLALATNPELLVLDEPTAGMDVVARREFLDLVTEQVTASGAAVFFSTHLIDEVEVLADRIAIVERGRTIYSGSLADLASRVVAFSTEQSGYPDINADSLSFSSYARILSDQSRDGRRRVVVDFGADAATDVGPGLPWRREELSLEDIFVAIVAGQT